MAFCFSCWQGGGSIGLFFWQLACSNSCGRVASTVFAGFFGGIILGAASLKLLGSCEHEAGFGTVHVVFCRVAA